MNLQKEGRNNSKLNEVQNRVTFLLLAIYLIALYWILLLKLGVRFSYMANRRINLIPFREFLVLNGKINFSELILNVLIFVPLGIYAEILFHRWTFSKKLFVFFFTSLIVEGLQFAFYVGAFDITDIITNTSGGIIGLMIFQAITKALTDRVRAQKFTNMVAASGTVLFMLLLLLLKMDMLPVKYR